MSWFKLFFINFLILFVLAILIELIWFFYQNNYLDKETCQLDWVAYNYCPDLKITRLNSVADGSGVIEIQVDALGGRIRSGTVSSLNTAHRFMIGDSFIQADEMAYENTLYGKWNEINEGSTYGLGYSSWNPIQYFDAIKKIGRVNSHYYVFLMTNDVNPNYFRSVYGELNTEKKHSFDFIRNMFFLRALRFIMKQIPFLAKHAVLEKNYKSKIDANTFSKTHIDDCRVISKFQDDFGMYFDYLVFSKSNDCWPELHKKAFEDFVVVTNKIQNYVQNVLSSEITFVWVSAGWAHLRQNSLGRLKYGFPSDITITQQGLINEFKNRFPGSNVVNTEQLISDDLSLCIEDCKDKYFYAQDGHWTPYTHNLIKEKLRSLF